MKLENRSFSLSIVSGKGGVGKTNLALNISFALQQCAHETLLIDCDLGLANLDVLLGIFPEKNLHDILNSEAKAEDIIFRLKDGPDLIPAASGISDLLDLDEDQQILIIESLKPIIKRYHFLLLDVGAGISHTVRSFARMTHKQIVVITPEPTSLTDGYAMIKVLNLKYGVQDFLILVNMAGSNKEAIQGFERIRAACARFLDLEVEYLGYVFNDVAVMDSVRRQIPLLKMSPLSVASKNIRKISEKLIELRQRSLEDISIIPCLRMENFYEHSAVKQNVRESKLQ